MQYSNIQQQIHESIRVHSTIFRAYSIHLFMAICIVGFRNLNCSLGCGEQKLAGN